MKRKNNLLLASAMLSLVLFASCDARKDRAKEIIILIYNHQKTTGHFPCNLHELELSEHDYDTYFYELTGDSSEFSMYYGLGLGESVMFESNDSSWHMGQ